MKKKEITEQRKTELIKIFLEVGFGCMAPEEQAEYLEAMGK